MSRCYPFPPPGYEKKTRVDDTDLLKKEKRREKKHKKEKKDKEKREGKETREKDRSDGEHRDKKEGEHRDKKEGEKKHRDKKKEKDRDKGKEKARISGEKRIAGQYENYDKQRLYQEEKNGDKDKSSVSNEKKQTTQFQGYDREKPIQNSLLAEETEGCRFLQELDRRIRDEEKGAGSQLVERFASGDPRKEEGMGKLVVKDTGPLVEGKKANKDRRVDNRKMDARGIRYDAGFSGNAMAQNITGMVQNGIEGMPRPMEKNIETRMEGKEKSKEKEANDKRGVKRKDKNREEKSQKKDKDVEKEKKKAEKVKEKSEKKFLVQDKVEDSNKNGLIDTAHIGNLHLPKESDRIAAAEGNINKEVEKEKKKVEKVKERSDKKFVVRDKVEDSNKNGLIDTTHIGNLHLPQESDRIAAGEANINKRSNLGTNGFSHADDVRPNKIPRHTTNLLTENGRKLEPCQTSILFTSDRPGTANNFKLDNKECKRNGIIEVQPSLSISSMAPLPAVMQADQIAEASRKPPHPDSKFLSKVLSVPKMEEWLDFDEQEWLFSSNIPPSKKPNVGSLGANETPLVWAEPLKIESADVCALPYVIPY